MTFVMQPERVILRKQIRSLLENLDFDFALDVGGGDGTRYRDLINASKFRSLDIDPSSRPDIVASADSIPLENSSVDLILSAQMLEHVTDPKLCLGEMYRVLQSDGLLLVTVPFLGETHSEPNDFWRFTSFGFELLLRESGFEVITILNRGSYRAVKSQFLVRYLIEKFAQERNGWPIRKLVAVFARIYVPVQLSLDRRYFQSRVDLKFSLGYTALARKVCL
jgi:SAM-dependent methyltransferase